jgi:hypothetical protein
VSDNLEDNVIYFFGKYPALAEALTIDCNPDSPGIGID